MVIQSDVLKKKVLGMSNRRQNSVHYPVDVCMCYDDHGLIDIVFSARCHQIIERIQSIWLYKPYILRLRNCIFTIIKVIETRITDLSNMMFQLRLAAGIGLNLPYSQNIKESVSYEEALFKIDALLKICHFKKDQLIRILYRLELSRIPREYLRRLSFRSLARNIDKEGHVIQHVDVGDSTFGADYLYKPETLSWFVLDIKQVFVDMNPIYFCVNLMGCSVDATEAAIITYDDENFEIPPEDFETYVNIEESIFDSSKMNKEETKPEKNVRQQREKKLVTFFLNVYKAVHMGV